MALENLAEIEKTLGIEEGKLTEMISSEEKHTIDLTKKVILDKTVYDERVSNIKKESSSMASEILIKDLRNEFGLDFEGKTKENLTTALKGHIDKVKDESIKDPEKRYTDLKSDFEKLQKNFIDKESESQKIKTDMELKEKRNKVLGDVFKFIPENALVSKNTIIIEAEQKGFSFDVEEGVTVVKDASGKVIKDETTLSPKSVKDWMEIFIVPFVPKVQGGGGGGDDKGGGGKAGSFEAFMKEAEKNDWDDETINQEIMKRTKDGTLKM
jgi:hypothetical protein